MVWFFSALKYSSGVREQIFWKSEKLGWRLEVLNTVKYCMTSQAIKQSVVGRVWDYDRGEYIFMKYIYVTSTHVINASPYDFFINKFDLE